MNKFLFISIIAFSTGGGFTATSRRLLNKTVFTIG
uniref:Uncharacterized protein n=1 Tax=Myoviridae sp. ctByu2 TaxID=2827668 RepID=A0A8S5S9T3_9CAUD|nr:MAG TPA: hypothetical protein [Myoviridae sp. ctByu2]